MKVSSLPVPAALAATARAAALRCGANLDGSDLPVSSPINGGQLASVALAGAGAVDEAATRAGEAFRAWRTMPAPARGALVRRFGDLVQERKDDLATLISLEVGKITSEALGEVQEVIDICGFAAGLSRQLYGRTISSERPGHRLTETWHPLGPVGVITAFNFPAAVWSWNSAIALVCGDPVIWKPSELAPLTALACAALLDQAIDECGAPPFLSQVLIGGQDLGTALVDHPGVALLSATGSTRMGQEVGPRVARRFGRVLLELGGNNAAVVAPSANLDLALRGILFAAAGTAGQRCTTLRRLIAHVDIIDELVDRIADGFARLPVGDPTAPDTLVGPLIHGHAYQAMSAALASAREQGGVLVTGGGRQLEADAPDAFYVTPALVSTATQTEVVRAETFAPLLYVLPYDDLDEAVALNNAVPQGLSSSIFTRDLNEAERFLSAAGSDCGIANVNIGTSGAEIGGAFGGEKETGGGREAGSDAWRAYMRRATNTVNFSGSLPLAQGVEFSL
ncbi:aldehyde dehydrogenase family protein [Frankia sp. CiP3]|uniref:L-piperidine-6-carboxylate dehydrogenase n=1 Tax=Frankia sp. CiP3 TaxID=2880971 RepID=UPI001EF69FB8|nr:aldehyde dehydrogenase family protein [Frankia sp. CiP3]